MGIILAAINKWDAAKRIVAVANRAGRALDAEVSVYCPVSSPIDELNRYVGFDNIEESRASLIAETKVVLEEQGIEAEVEWHSSPYKGVVARAEALSAQLIVMSVSEHAVVGDLLHRPDDWHLLREASCPVWILGEQSHSYTAVTVALDVLSDQEELDDIQSGRLLDMGKQFSKMFACPLRVISVVPDPGVVFSDMVVADNAVMADFRMRAEEVVRQRQARKMALFGATPSRTEIVLGRVDTVLREYQQKGELLVVGNHARKGISGFFLGNTAERLLAHLAGDMVVVD